MVFLFEKVLWGVTMSSSNCTFFNSLLTLALSAFLLLVLVAPFVSLSEFLFTLKLFAANYCHVLSEYY